MRKRLFSILTLIFVICFAISISGCGKKNAEVIRFGSKSFTENLILAELYSLALEDNGYTVERKFNLAGAVVHGAITSNQIDIYPEYTGTGLLSILKHDLVTDPQQVYDIVKSEYKSKFNLVWLDYSKANDSQGLVINKAIADKLGIKTISDLQKNADKIRFASQGVFDMREDGLPAIEKAYGKFNFKSKAIFDNGLKYNILSEDKADLAVAYTTEGPLVDPRFIVLEDDKKVWPPYNIAPVIRGDVLSKYPDIANILNKVSYKIDTKTIIGLNAEVDVKKVEYDKVAKDFYKTIK